MDILRNIKGLILAIFKLHVLYNVLMQFLICY